MTGLPWALILVPGLLQQPDGLPLVRQDAATHDTASHGCVQARGKARPPRTTDLKDDVLYYGFLRRCLDGRLAILAIDLVELYEGDAAIREAAKDGKTLETDVDPIEYMRNRNPRLRLLRVKPDADVRMFDCSLPGCPARHAHLHELPWNMVYRFRLKNGLIVYVELPYSP